MHTKTHSQSTSQLDVLVVEDSGTQAELLRSSLTAHGYRVTVAGNGMQALDQARRRKPSLVITDVVMPGMDGYQLCRTIKADPQLKDVPVIIVTSLKEMDDIITALECGADNFLRKPFDTAVLLARIEYLMANRNLRSHSRLKSGIDISLGGKRHLITAQREQILDLLFTSYEEALQANAELVQRQNEIQSLNLKLARRAVELEDANKQLRAFSHTVSHDLRSPLTTINGFSAILERNHAGGLDAKALSYLSGIKHEAGRMTRIVEDILYLTNIERSNIDRSSVDLSQIAMDALTTLRDADPQRNLKFDCDTNVVAHCDERLMKIAMVNLLSNAWKFTSRREDPHISFCMVPFGAETAFCVRDNGAGFDMSHAGRLFSPFQRFHRNDEFPGFGIGLATVQRIVGLHGGRIWAESAPDQGAAFYFVLGQ